MFNQKEVGLISDLKNQESICAEKYKKYAQEAADPQLKGLFTAISRTEQEHWNTLNGMLQGNIPSMQNATKGSGKASSIGGEPAVYATADAKSPQKQADSFLCADALAMEKHVSAEYNTCIFEFRDEKVRDALSHIQKEEQEHGYELYGYMAKNGMNSY